jgi:two-component system, cell cycle sensor histidine kinase and response regulator CckA
MSAQGKDPDKATDGREVAGDRGDPADSRDRARDDAADLRRRAEARLDEAPGAVPVELEGLSLDHVRGMLHELKVHQIELELQNEELRRSRAELEVSHERYFDLFDLAPVGYFTLAEDSVILEANLTGGGLLGVARGDLVDRPFTGFVFPEDQDVYYLHRRVVVNTGSPATCELRLVRTDGSTLHALLESAPSLPVEDRATYRTVVSDITERTRAATDRLLLEQRLQQVEKAESLGRMAGSMAHHFNNLLGVITGNLELVLDGFADDPEQATPGVIESLRDALAGALKAGDLTRRLLMYLGHADGDPIVMDLSEVGRRGIPLLEIAMPLGTELEADLPSPGPLVRMNPRSLQQLLTNLVTNAWEASEPEKASVHLAVSTVPASEVPERDRFPAEWRPQASSYACLQVRDDGRGIDAESLSDIFDPFFSSKSFGRGLGLSVALGTVKAHGGALCVSSVPGRGTTFKVYLPVAETPATDAEEGGETTPLPTRKPSEGVHRPKRPPAGDTSAEPATVLVVDDNAMVRRLAVSALGRMGLQALQAADGHEALEVFEKHRDRIKAVLCDVMMPRMGGWDTLTALRRIDPEIPVILTSGYDEASVALGSYPEQPDAFLGKPWHLEQLRDALAQVLQGLDGAHGFVRWE